jgi:hypothetical protein
MPIREALESLPDVRRAKKYEQMVTDDSDLAG